MTLQHRMREFGFLDVDHLPRVLNDHAVSLSLPSAMEHGLDPVEITIRRGLAIPAQVPGSANGVIVRSDGMVLHVGHHDPKDLSSPLEAKFVKDIPYDLRVELSNIMRRAVQADPSLAPVWESILRAWKLWFPLKAALPGIKHAGTFAVASAAWKAVCRTLEQLVTKLESQKSDAPQTAGIRIVVQNEPQARQGWLGEEILVDEVQAAVLIKEGSSAYARRHLLVKMRQVLASPVFHSRSSFRVLYEPRSAHTIKLVVIPPSGRTDAASFGIDLA
jgi:hypothetical protein